MQSKRSESCPERPFRHVGENLYRRESSGVYYALLKKGRKQFRCSLRTTDRELARRRLAELRAQIGVLTSDDARKVTFDVVAQRWLDSVRHTLKESTARRREQYLRALSPFFAGLSLREITPAHCEAWVAKRGDKIAPPTFAHELERRGRAPAVSRPPGSLAECEAALADRWVCFNPLRMWPGIELACGRAGRLQNGRFKVIEEWKPPVTVAVAETETE